MLDAYETLVAPVREAQRFVYALSALATVAVLLEMAYDARARAPRDWRETLANWLVALPNGLVQFALVPLLAGLVLGGITALRGPSLPVTGWSWALGFVLVDLNYYVTHRLEHRVRFLWAHHAAHHSSTDFDLSTALRLAWHDGWLEALYLAPLALLGFAPGQLLVLAQLVLVYQTWVHTRRVGALPTWFRAVFNTPAAHRVHHASNERYLDRNYGGVLVLWDRLFGTYADELASEPVRYGLTRPPEGINPVRVSFGEYARIARDLRAARTVREALLTVFGPPEWSEGRSFAKTRARSWWRRALSERAPAGDEQRAARAAPQ